MNAVWIWILNVLLSLSLPECVSVRDFVILSQMARISYTYDFRRRTKKKVTGNYRIGRKTNTTSLAHVHTKS